MKSRTRFAALLSMSVAAACIAVGPATAAIAAPATTPALLGSSATAAKVAEARLSAASGKACLIDLDVAKPKVACFSDFAALKTSVARAGHALVIPSRSSALGVNTSLRVVSPKKAGATEYLLNTDYADTGYTGNTYSYETTDSDMCDGNSFGHSSMPSGWNDRISSFNAYGNCSEKLWENTGYTGTTVGYTGGKSSLGSFNDEASSERVQ